MGIRYITVNGQTDITRGLEATQVFSFIGRYLNTILLVIEYLTIAVVNRQTYGIVKVSTPR